MQSEDIAPPNAEHPETRKKSGVWTRPSPPMRVVTKGWWTFKEELVSVDDLKKDPD
jgi:hypothetical protein